jgi:hypothetical protein
MVVYYTSLVNEEARKSLKIMMKAPTDTFNVDVSEFWWRDPPQNPKFQNLDKLKIPTTQNPDNSKSRLIQIEGKYYAFFNEVWLSILPLSKVPKKHFLSHILEKEIRASRNKKCFFGILSFLGFWAFGILSLSGFQAFEIMSRRDYVFSGFCYYPILVTKVMLKISTVRTTENVNLLRNSGPRWERIFLHNKTINIDCKYDTNKWPRAIYHRPNNPINISQINSINLFPDVQQHIHLRALSPRQSRIHNDNKSLWLWHLKIAFP